MNYSQIHWVISPIAMGWYSYTSRLSFKRVLPEVSMSKTDIQFFTYQLADANILTHRLNVSEISFNM